MTREEKFIGIRNQLITDAINEMGEDKARKFFRERTNRDSINEIARYKSVIMPDRNLDVEQFRKNKWQHDKKAPLTA